MTVQEANPDVGHPTKGDTQTCDIPTDEDVQSIDIKVRKIEFPVKPRGVLAE